MNYNFFIGGFLSLSHRKQHENNEKIKKGDNMSCTCQRCGNKYKVDIIVSDQIWKLIQPVIGEEGNGLLCGICIIALIEEMNKYNYFYLIDEKAI